MSIKVLISAQLSTISPEQNRNVHHFLRRDLTASLLAGGIQGFREVTGVYRGQRERSFLVEVDVLTDNHVASFVELARRYSQESVLFVGEDAVGCLLYTDGREQGQLEFLPGKWHRFDPTIAGSEPESYTVDGDDYFTIS